MAREMNVDKRIVALNNMIVRAEVNRAKAQRIAEELTNSFRGDKTPKGKKAQEIAQRARKLAAALQRVTAVA